MFKKLRLLRLFKRFYEKLLLTKRSVYDSKLISERILLKITASSLKIAFFSFGGGVAVISLIHKEFIQKNKLMDEEQFDKLVILANTLPGPTILQLTTYISFYAGSYIGAIISYIIILFSGPMLLILILEVLRNYVSADNLSKIALSVIPAIMGMLWVFTYGMIKKDRVINYNWFFYCAIMIFVLLLLFLGINIVYIFILLILFLVFVNIDAINPKMLTPRK